MENKHNILIISDIHLGGDINHNKGDSPAFMKFDLAERELIRFLEYHTLFRRNGLPWRLIINGDLIDFLAICLPIPKIKSKKDRKGTCRRITIQDQRSSWIACKKMAAATQRLQAFFAALAKFLNAGHKVELIAGNHDAEFQWIEVQTMFREAIKEQWSKEYENVDLDNQITFHPWFYYEKDLLWVEHGHLHDKTCSFESVFAGTADDNAIIGNIDALSVRLVINQIPGALYVKDTWSFFGYLSWGFELGIKDALKLVRAYCVFSFVSLMRWKNTNRSVVVANKKRRHDNELKDLSVQWNIPTETLLKLDANRQQPVFFSLWPLMQVLMLDKLLFLISMIVFVLLFVQTIGWIMTGLYVASATMLFHLFNYLIERKQEPDLNKLLIRMSGNILTQIQTKYIVFGHTHIPLIENFNIDNQSKTYINGGTWFPSEPPGLLHCFTYVSLLVDAPMTLCQWRGGEVHTVTPERDWYLSNTKN